MHKSDNKQAHLLGHKGDGNSDSLLTFPEKFPIKIFGLDNQAFQDAVNTVVTAHVTDEDLLSRQENTSSKGNYLAITVTIMAQSQAQLDAIYIDLTNNEHVKMAL